MAQPRVETKLTPDQRGLVEDHIGLARALARRFSHRGEPIEDLEQVALLGMARAARRFDHARGVDFAVYATASVLGELKRYFRDHHWVLRVPRRTQETYLRLRAASETLEQEFCRPPTVAELAQDLEVGEEHVLEALDAAESLTTASLDAHPVDEVSTGAERLSVDEPGYERCLERNVLRELVGGLDERDRALLKRYFLDGWTQCQVANEVGVSQMQVSRLLRQVIDRLRDEAATAAA